MIPIVMRLRWKIKGTWEEKGVVHPGVQLYCPAGGVQNQEVRNTSETKTATVSPSESSLCLLRARMPYDL